MSKNILCPSVNDHQLVYLDVTLTWSPVIDTNPSLSIPVISRCPLRQYRSCDHRWRSEKGPTLTVWRSNSNIITAADAKSGSEASFERRGLFFQRVCNTARKDTSIFKEVSIFCCLLIMWEQGVVSAVALLQHPAESHNYANLCRYYFPSGRSLGWITLLLWNSGLNNIYEKSRG